MVTKEDAATCREFHAGTCVVEFGPRGARTDYCRRWRASGQRKTWATRPGEFRLPVKWGLRLSSEITHRNAGDWHRADDPACPINHTNEQLQSIGRHTYDGSTVHDSL